VPPDSSCGAWLVRQALFRRAQLRELVDLHGEDSVLNGGYLGSDEIGVILGALDLRAKTAEEAMTSLEKVCPV
jgi:hypothetical protein